MKRFEGQVAIVTSGAGSGRHEDGWHFKDSILLGSAPGNRPV